LSDRVIRYNYAQPTGLTQNIRSTIFTRKNRPWTE